MSKTVAVYPIISAFAEAYRVGKAITPWWAVNREQERYLENLKKWEAELSLLTPEELEVISSYDASDLNTWLKPKGFDITLKPFTGPDDFGTASVMKVLVKWITPGKKVWLTKGDQEYRAAKVEEDIYFTKSTDYPHPVAHICTENGDVVHMTIAADISLEGLDLLAAVSSLTEGNRIFNYDSVIFPMIDHNSEVDISFFVNMYFKGLRRSGPIGTCRVKEAKQQTKFSMTEIGAKAESAVAVSMCFESVCFSKPPMIVNDTFYVWMTRDGMSAPYFAGCIDSTDWKDPGDLEGNKSKKAQVEPIAEVIEALFSDPENCRAPRGRLEVM